MRRAVMVDGALSAKVKELIALAIAATRECDGCIASHARGAAHHYASEAEVAEAIGVVVLMNGGPGTVWGPRALAAYREFGLQAVIGRRTARERLNAIICSTRQDATGSWDVVYVSLSGGGRGQIAVALTTLLSDGRVSVHSAVTAVRGEIDPGVRAVIAELGVDHEHAFARPVTDEVLRAAEVIVTMGRSVGVIEIPEHVRHEDWRLGDPVGAPIDEIRRVRADIERRVRALLSDLGAATADRQTEVPAGGR